jgi:hypothetical protein
VKRLAWLVAALLVFGSVGGASSEVARDVRGLPGGALRLPDRPLQPLAACSPQPQVVEIRQADPAVDKAHHDLMVKTFIEKAGQADTTILLGPDVVLDFSAIPKSALPISIGRCVTIRSVAWFPPAGRARIQPGGAVLTSITPPPSAPTPRAAAIARVGPAAAGIGDRPTEVLGEGPGSQPIPEARSSTSFGPLLKFGPHRPGGGDSTFLEIGCAANDPAPQADHVRISGFRIFGPSMGQQEVGDRGMLVSKCVDIEIRNMEVAGFGGEGIRVQDDKDKYFDPYPLQVNLTEEPEAYTQRGRTDIQICHEPPFAGPNGRISRPEDVRIIGNFIHNNQQPRTITDGHAGGYGVEVTYGAFALISQNLFSANRHSIAAGGTMGGYVATQNLTLRYGGIHFDTLFTVHTHSFDIHGTGKNGFGGWAGARTTYAENAFQYDNGNAIKIRGSPRCGVEIRDNVFPHHGLEKDWGADAVALQFREDLAVIKLGPNNRLDTQTYGKYGVCDFDGDGIDDLFLATGVSWWVSGMGEFPWRFLALRNERLDQVRFGYFDADNKCDVLTESGASWVISSGGTGQWYRMSQAYAPLSQVAFGRFDLTQRDHRPGATRRTTQAFWRRPGGEWVLANLTGPDQSWRHAQSSSLAFSDLRFGDFTGDGVTDVLSVQSGHWAISSGAQNPWRRINDYIGDHRGEEVWNLLIADIDNDNIDDVMRVVPTLQPAKPGRQAMDIYEWQVSYGGSTYWKPLKSLSWPHDLGAVGQREPPRMPMFAGRFGTAPGAGVLMLDRSGIGRFHAPLESRVGASPDWSSTFNY